MCLEKKLSGKKLLLTKKNFFITIFFIIVFGTGFAKVNYDTNPDGTTHYAYFTPDHKEDGGGEGSGNEGSGGGNTTPEGDPPPSTTPPEGPSAPTTPEGPGGNGGGNNGGSSGDNGGNGGSSGGSSGSGSGGSGSGNSGSSGGSSGGSGGSSGGSGSGGSGSSGSGYSGGSSSGDDSGSGDSNSSGSRIDDSGVQSHESPAVDSKDDSNDEKGSCNAEASNESENSNASQAAQEKKEAEVKKFSEEISKKEESVNQLRQELSNEYKKHGSAGIKQESLNAMAKLQQDIAKDKQSKEEKKSAAKKEKQNKKEEKASKVDGDPVRLTVGSYEQNEIDIHINGAQEFEITRKYKSDNTIVSSFGYGWVSNLDQRIISGVEAYAQTDYDKLLSSLNERLQIIAACRQDIINGYGLSSIENGEMEIIASIDKCRQIKLGGLALVEELGSNSFSEAPEEVLPALSGAIANAQNLAAEAEADALVFETKLEAFRNEVALLNQMQAEYNQKKIEADDFYANIVAPSLSRHQKNSFALFSGMKSDYDETGLDTLIVIDEDGYPHLLYESAEGSGEWKNGTEKEIIKVAKTSGGYKLLMKDGCLRDFDENGSLIKLTDRNGNFVELKRNAGEKISSVESSSGEKYSFDYIGNFVSKITNVRLSEENVVFSYRGNALSSVRDTDGDLVTMTYDANGRMTSLNKCDGSSVLFIYGEQTADGRVLATATTNEEGFTEYFEYDRSGKRTDYINHDGDRTIYWYDDSHRTVRELRPDGTDIVNTYDAEGNLTSVNQNGNSSVFSYDRDGNKLSALYSDGTAEYWTYDSFNLMTSHTDRGGVKEEYLRDERGNLKEYRLGGKTVYAQDFDARGQVIKKTLYGQKPVVTFYTYDSYGNLKSQTCGGMTIEYEYDNRNRVTKIKRAGKVIAEYEYYGHKSVQKDFNGLKTTYLTNGRKDLIKISQKDTVTGIVYETRIEYDKRHLPLKVFSGDGEEEKLIAGYLYTPEGKLRAEVYYGSEVWIKLYEYKNGQISEFKQFAVNGQSTLVQKQASVVEPVETTITEQQLNKLLALAGDKVFVQKYDYQLQGSSGRLLTVTDAAGTRSLFEYDCFGNLVKNTDGNGELREKLYRGGYLKREQNNYGGWYEYEYTDGRMTKAGEQGGSAIEIEYYPDDSIKSVRDRYGMLSAYYYDDRGRVSSIQNDSRKIWYQYDSFDRITKQIVGNSPGENACVYYELYEYSADGRRVEVTEGGKYKTILEVDAFGNITKETDGNANERSFVYNCLNQMTESYDGYGNKTLYDYNALGKISKVRMPDGAETKYQYNYMGLLEKVTDDCGTVYSASYDNIGRLVREFSRADSEKTYEYDRGGRVTRLLCGGQLVESYTYANNNRTITVKDGNGSDYIYKYDAFGRLVSERNRKNLEQNYFYDENGQLKNQQNFEGALTTVNYSDDRTVMTVRYSDGSENRFVYDMAGNIIEAANAYGETVYSYDQGGSLISQKDVISGEEVYFEYDDCGNRIRLYSSNRETLYTYGKNNEVKELFDNKQRVSIKLSYDKNGREVLRQFGNGTSEETLYDRAGRVSVKMQKNYRDELLWGEGYVYGADGKRTATVDNAGRVTFYEYNPKGQLAAVYYPYTQEMESKLKTEAQTNGLPLTTGAGENRFLTSAEKSDLVQLLNSMKYGLAYNLPAVHVVIKESYEYDGNGNRISKTNSFGKIEYTYDKENCLLASGSKGQHYVTYSYDNMGNLLTEESSEKSVKYAYNAENRMIYCEVMDRSEKEYAQTNYSYDTFGRRILVQDMGEAALRTLYDGFSFDMIKQSPILENGLFADSNNTGIRWSSSGQPTGDRYRYLGDATKEDKRYLYLDDNSYKTVNTRYKGERTAITVNNTLSAQISSDYGPEYFSTDLLGSVSGISGSTGESKASFTYDAFGSLVQGTLSAATDFGYLGKQIDPTASLYNYGYRDYKPQTARFTTTDPIRDGHNWFSYCNSDPVNFVDLWGLNASDNIKVYIYRDKRSYNYSNDRDHPQNTSLDTLVITNETSGQYKVFSGVQSVANYPSTDKNHNTVESCFMDTIGTCNIGIKVYTTTSVAPGTAAEIINATTLDGRKVNQYAYTEKPKSDGRALIHSDEIPDGSGNSYNTSYSKQCVILKKEDNKVFFDTLKEWGVQDDDVIKGTIIDTDRRDR